MAPASLAAVLQNMAGVPQASEETFAERVQARDLVQQRLNMAPKPVQPPAPPEPAKKEDILRNVAHNATLTSIEPDTWTPDRDLCERPKEEKPPAPPEEDDKKGSDRKPEDEAPGAADSILLEARMRGAEAFEITNKQTYNFNSMSEAHQPRLRDQILKNTYFKLVKIDTFEGIMDEARQQCEMYQYVETAETYGGGSTHAASVQFPTVPSSLFCCLYRLFTIGIAAELKAQEPPILLSLLVPPGLSYDELNLLCESKDWPYISCAPEKLWDFLGEYCVDDQEFEPSKSTPGFVVTIGEYVEAGDAELGCDMDAQRYRKRAAQNKDMLSAFKEAGTPVEVTHGQSCLHHANAQNSIIVVVTTTIIVIITSTIIIIIITIITIIIIVIVAVITSSSS
ncbi:hypothetical protein AK812_SmicGene9318 [Symbiodinium microadriaticum]|uniref:Pre-mRNA-splicing factor 38 n=1 Tax=Symbiodinium microadriaticum TaxID=2951 RepID=A0A1Q9EIM8_SYMMI|nr:hypothetical protein AK812_SmicGene9318 [Symbiodinium microadriaticum]